MASQLVRTEGLYVVERYSPTWGVRHVAVLLCQRDDWSASRLQFWVLEFWFGGLRFSRASDDGGWRVVGRIADQLGARHRLDETLRLGAGAYNLFFNNCEHVVSHIASDVRQSPQVRSAAAAAALVLLVIRSLVGTSRAQHA